VIVLDIERDHGLNCKGVPAEGEAGPVKNKDLDGIMSKLDIAMKKSFDPKLSSKINMSALAVVKKVQAKYKTVTDFKTLIGQASKIGQEFAKETTDTVKKLGELAAQGNNKALINFIQNASKVFLQTFVSAMVQEDTKGGDIQKVKEMFEDGFLNVIKPVLPKDIQEKI
jgi:hypothetical protein